jgi:hypothetical protein
MNKKRINVEMLAHIYSRQTSKEENICKIMFRLEDSINMELKKNSFIRYGLA